MLKRVRAKNNGEQSSRNRALEHKNAWFCELELEKWFRSTGLKHRLPQSFKRYLEERYDVDVLNASKRARRRVRLSLASF